MRYGKASMIHFDTWFCLEVYSIYDFYNFGLESREHRIHEFESRAARLPEEIAEDEWGTIANLRRQIGYAVTIMLCSAFEESLLTALRHLGLKREDLWKNEWKDRNRGKGLLEAFSEVLKERLNLDFSSNPAVSPTSAGFVPLVPDGLDIDVGALDYGLVRDFVWARNRIVHHRGLAKFAEAKKHTVPILPRDGILFDDEAGELITADDASRVRVEISKEYIERATAHLIALVRCVAREMGRHETR